MRWRCNQPILNHPIPYRTDKATKLIRLGKSYITLGSLYESVFILGSTGSGKSSSIIRYLMHTALATTGSPVGGGCGAGALILTSKPSDCEDYLRIIRAAGRIDDVMIMDAENKDVRVNLFDLCCATEARDGFVHNLVELVMQLSDALRIAKRDSGNSDSNLFFKEAMEVWLRNALTLLVAANPSVKVRDLYNFIISVPNSPEEVTSAEWQASSYCWHIFTVLDDLRKAGDARAARAIEDSAPFFLEESPRLGSKTRSSITASISNVISSLSSGVFHDLFCRDTNWVPQMAREGKILIVNLPVLKFGAMGAAIQNVMKIQFGKSLQAEPANDMTRPCLLMMDEYPSYANAEADAALLATARSSKLICVMAAQDISALQSKLGDEAAANAMFNLAGTKCLLASASVESNELAARLIGKTKKQNSSRTVSRGQNTGSGLNQGEEAGGTSGGEGRSQSIVESVSEYETFRVNPSYFSHGLKMGGLPHRTVEMIIVRNGTVFPETGAHWIKTAWRQI